MGSAYVAEKRPQPAAGYGKVLFGFQEFFAQWEDPRLRVLVFIKERRLRELTAPNKLLQIGEIALVTNQ